ncbi:MAG: type II toxin-antitoxin system RelE/ParE family toxin [Rhizobiales bacterium]|mgnify:FL=1|nr:type II toxin-antitoxin system RelE/ParE family toxin [Hyphomicrobiales bacterium]
MKIVWTSRAVGELIAIADYITIHNPAAAIATRDRIKGAVQRLSDFAQSGRPGRVAETRELIVPGTRFVVVYRVRGEHVQILAIFHAARDWPEGF